MNAGNKQCQNRELTGGLLADMPVSFDFDRATARSTRKAQLSEWHRVYLREHNSSNIQRLLADMPVGFDFDGATARSTRKAQLSEWHRVYYITGNILLLLL